MTTHICLNVNTWCCIYVVVMGFCPIARAKRFNEEGSILSETAAHLGLAEAQVCIQWAVENGIVTIPKSTNHERITANLVTHLPAAAADGAAAKVVGDMLDSLDSDFVVSGAQSNMYLEWSDIC